MEESKSELMGWICPVCSWIICDDWEWQHFINYGCPRCKTPLSHFDPVYGIHKKPIIYKKMEKGTQQSCTCEECKAACQYKPGWFLPGEAEKVAKYLGMSLEKLFKTRLAVDWWEGNPDIFVLSPKIIGEKAGTEFPANPEGTCTFFKNGLCTIHPVKPFECHKMIHGEKDEIISKRHKEIAEAWKLHQDQIKKLLGRNPESKEFYF